MKPLVLPLVLVAFLSLGFLYWAFSQKKAVSPSKPIVSGQSSTHGIQSTGLDLSDRLLKAQEAIGKGNFKLTVELLEPVQNAGDFQINSVLAGAFEKLGRPGSAAYNLELALEKKNDPDILFDLGNLYAAMGRNDLALKTFISLEKEKVTQERREGILLGWAQAASSTSDYVTTLDVLKKTMREFPDRETGSAELLKLIQQLPAKTALAELEELREKCEQTFRKSFSFQFGVGLTYYRAGKKTEAREYLKRSSELKPKDTSPRMILYKIEREGGNAVGALEHLDAIITNLPAGMNSPMKPDGFFKAALEAKRNSRFDLAFRFLRASVLHDKSLLGKDDQGTVAAVAEYLNKNGLEEEKGFMLGFLAYFNGDSKETQKAIKAVLPKIKGAKLKADAETLLADCMSVISGEEAYQKFVSDQEEARRMAAAASTAAAVRAQQNQPTAKNSKSDRVAKIAEVKAKAAAHREDAAYQYEAGRNLFSFGDLAGAKESFQAALGISPGLWEAYHCLGLITLQEKKYGESAAYLEKAMKLAPRKYFLFSLYASVKLRMGDISSALEASRKALELNPQSGQAHLVLADIYTRSKRDDDAMAEVNQGLAGESDPRMIEQLRAMKKVIAGE